jgi:hypothetical protein
MKMFPGRHYTQKPPSVHVPQLRRLSEAVLNTESCTGLSRIAFAGEKDFFHFSGG